MSAKEPSAEAATRLAIAPGHADHRPIDTHSVGDFDAPVGEVEAQGVGAGYVDLIRSLVVRPSGREPEGVFPTAQALAHLAGRLLELEDAVRSVVREHQDLKGILLDRPPVGRTAGPLLGGRPPCPDAEPPRRPEGGRSLAHPDTIPTGEAGGRGRSPYLDATEAAAYLGITLKSLYGIVERGHLEPLRGPRRRYRFTSAMLDEYLARRGGR